MTTDIATKSTEVVGGLMHRLDAADLRTLSVCAHVRRLVECACRLGAQEHLEELPMSKPTTAGSSCKHETGRNRGNLRRSPRSQALVPETERGPRRQASSTKTTKPLQVQGLHLDGARGTRTPDLLGAIQALSQLSYSPG
jgi:hypothetical protein